MSEFRRLCVLSRILNNSENLCPQFTDGFRQDSNRVHCPDNLSRALVEKIATRSHLPHSELCFVHKDHVFAPEQGEWKPTDPKGDWEPLPVYENQIELQFEKFLLERPGKYAKENPRLMDIRKHCASHHLKKHLFRGTLDDENNLGEAPGLPYWVGIPRNGIVQVHTTDPCKLKKSAQWHRMGLTWLGRVEYV